VADEDAKSAEPSEAQKKLAAAVSRTARYAEDTTILWPHGAKVNSDDEMLTVDSWQDWTIPPLVAGTWVQMSEEEKDKEKRWLGARSGMAAKIAANVTRIRKLPIAFYPDAMLFEAEVRRGNTTGAYDYVRSAGDVLELNGTAAPIRKFDNENSMDENGVTRKRLRIENLEQASQYIHFFDAALSVETGTFRVLDSAANLNILHDAPAATREALSRLVKPFRLRQNSDGKWIGDGAIANSDELFYVVMAIDPTAASPIKIEMDSTVASHAPIVSEYVVDGLRVLSDYSYRSGQFHQQASRLEKEKKWAEAADAESKIIELARATPALGAAQRNKKLAGEYVDLSWFRLLQGNFAASLEASEAGLKFDDKKIELDGNRADALLLLGRDDEALAIYRRHLGESIEKRSWESLVLGDLKDLESNGFSSPAFAEVRRIMQAPKRADDSSTATHP